jgi:NADH:ubiquinone oxidoreductase subunit 2 (subunit N)
LSFWSYLFETLVIIFVYIFIYNTTLMIFFWNFHQFISFLFKSIYSFSNFKFSFYFLISFTISLFSMAGVPPFAGFFSKLFLIVAISNYNFVIFYFFFFSLLFLGLYFYIQNIRFLYSSKSNYIENPIDKIMKISTIYFIISLSIIFFLTLGPIFMDDWFYYFYWFFK